jgi:hypothetical protein
MLRKIIGPKREEVRSGWKKLHNEDFMISTTQQILVDCLHMLIQSTVFYPCNYTVA